MHAAGRVRATGRFYTGRTATLPSCHYVVSMTVRLFVLALVLSLPLQVRAVPLPLPAGARWLVAVPRADYLITDAASFLEAAAKRSPGVSQHELGLQLSRSYGLPLLDREGLRNAGVDLNKPWLLFDRAGAEYLAVSVQDRDAFAQVLDRWARQRALQSRTEEKHGAALEVTFSRAAGTRAAAGYYIARGRAVILVAPAERTPELKAAYDAVEGAAPIEPPVHGSVVVWLGPNFPFRDGWLALRPRPDGLDLFGSAHKAEAGWFVRDPGRAAWLQELTASPDGTPLEHPFWLRVLAGPRSIGWLLDRAAQPGDMGAFGSWWQDLATLGGGPVELFARGFDVSPLDGGGRDDISAALLLVSRPEVVFANWPSGTMGPFVKSHFAETSTKPRCALSTDGSFHVCRAGTVAAANRGTSVAVGWGDDRSEPALPEALPGPPTLTCTAGTPIASGRLDLGSVFQGAKGVGFLDALSNDLLAGFYAVAAEYGGLMRASHPAIALACQESSGRLTLQGRWRFTPAPQ